MRVMSETWHDPHRNITKQISMPKRGNSLIEAVTGNMLADNHFLVFLNVPQGSCTFTVDIFLCFCLHSNEWASSSRPLIWKEILCEARNLFSLGTKKTHETLLQYYRFSFDDFITKLILDYILWYRSCFIADAYFFWDP